MRHLFLILSLTIFSISLSFSQEKALTELIKNELQELPEGTEISIGILENGNAVKIGYRVENESLVSVENSDKLFEIGSITKTFTASLIMKFVEEQKIDLSDPIQNYLPVQMAQDSFEGHTITVRDLLTHTSGLSEGPPGFTLPYLKAQVFSPKNPNRNFKARHYYRYLKKFELDYIPGREWDYNNAGYGLLGEFIKEMDHSLWEEAVEEYILVPLGMEKTFFEINQSNKADFITGITAKGKKSKPWEMQLINPAGAIKSTVEDILLYAAAQLESPSSAVDFLQAAQATLDYQIRMPEDKLWKGNAMGTGWWHNLEDIQNTFIWHGGGTGGYTAFVGFSHEKDKAVVILSNISSSHPLARGENRIPKPMLLGQKIMRME